MSLLGGVDALVFVADDVEQSRKFIGEICDSFGFLGISRENIIEMGEAVQEIGTSTLKTQVVCMEQNQLNIMVHDLKKTIHREI